ANAFLPHLGEIGMRPTVARNFVSFPSSPRQNLRMLSYHFAEHKERGLDMMRSEYVEQFRRKRRARSIVKGHRNVRSIDVHRVKGDRRFLGRSWSFFRDFLFSVRRCGGLRWRFDRVNGFSALDCRRSLACERNTEA